MKILKEILDITIAHSPDSDDAFMFYALANHVFDTAPYRFHHELRDIQTLNKWAFDGKYEVSAISIHAFAYLSEKYALMNSGASMGDGYGPKIIARKNITLNELKNVKIAVPGEFTTAYLALKILEPKVQTKNVQFDKIMDSVLDGKYDAGVIIHEGQLTYADQSFVQILDLGEWWMEQENLPLPLGGNVIRRDLGEKVMNDVADWIKKSIEFSLEHREKGLDYAMKYAGGLSRDLADRFVGMYVNEWTVDWTDRGRKAVQRLLDRGFEAGVIPQKIDVEFIG
ncbi:MAG: ABC transporter substrate-binding protein [Candidatus Marinimicrobia bacterium]|nr:ABC transporter substrate-binding protein [Candidatus Neomarinimicrobiota bacterium]